MKKFIWDSENHSIRGSFINIVITFTILLLIIIGAFSKFVMNNLKELSVLIIAFFTASFPVWRVTNAVMDYIQKKEEKANGEINTTG